MQDQFQKVAAASTGSKTDAAQRGWGRGMKNLLPETDQR